MAMRRQSLSLPNMISMRWRWRYSVASCGMGTFGLRVDGMQGVMPRAASSARKRRLS
jgi:hypothetical protein